MARVKVTPQNIKSKLQAWGQGLNIIDELVYNPKDGIDETEIINLGWANGVIIESLNDVGMFKKFIYKEKLV